jgi:hypothetical protein
MTRATEMCVELAQLWSSEHSAPAAPAGTGKERAGAERPVDWVG